MTCKVLGLGGNMALLKLKNYIFYILIALLSLNLAACGGFNSGGSSDNSGFDDDPIPDDDDGDDDDGDPSYEGGAGVYLRNVHPEISALYSKTYFHADLGDVVGTPGTSSMRQGGSIILTFEKSNGQKINRYFSTAGSTFTTLEKNFWTTKTNGDPMWRGIFQGEYGALVVVIDGVFLYGDGLGPDDTMSGSVWFRKWQVLEDQKLPTHECVLNSQGLWDCKNQSAPLRQCWYISRGPYDCRFMVMSDGKLVMRSADPANPSNDTEWVKLGTFNDLNKSKTFYETY